MIQMPLHLETHILEWLHKALGAPVTAVTPSQGATSSAIFFLTCQTGQRAVLRLLTNHEWLAHEPDLAPHEAAVLTAAGATGLPVPKLIALAPDKARLGIPAVLMSYEPGHVELKPANQQAWLSQMALMLSRIHRAPVTTDFAWHYTSWTDKTTLGVPDWSAKPALWQAAITRLRAGQPTFRPVFIHRDYHPANLLWEKETLVSVVDWINGCLGPAGVDVAHCRLNLTYMYGPDAADTFLAAYCQHTPTFSYDPYWDLDSLLDDAAGDMRYYEPWQHFGLEYIPPQTMCARREALLERVMALI